VTLLQSILASAANRPAGRAGELHVARTFDVHYGAADALLTDIKSTALQIFRTSTCRLTLQTHRVRGR
jgi:hypothetical protein